MEERDWELVPTSRLAHLATGPGAQFEWYRQQLGEREDAGWDYLRYVAKVHAVPASTCLQTGAITSMSEESST